MKLTDRETRLLSKMASGRKIIHSRDGDRAWLSGLGDNPVFGDLDWAAMCVLRGLGLIGDDEDGEEDHRFPPAEIITPAGRLALQGAEHDQ